MKQVKDLQNKSVKQLKSLNNRVFSSNVLQNENLNYIVGAIVAVLCVAVVQGHLKVPKVFNTTASRAIHLLVIVVVARHNLVLALILLTGYMVVSHYGGLEGFDCASYCDTYYPCDDNYTTCIKNAKTSSDKQECNSAKNSCDSDHADCTGYCNNNGPSDNNNNGPSDNNNNGSPE